MPERCHCKFYFQHDFDLHIQGLENSNVNILKMGRANEKFSSTTFIDVDICQRILPLRLVYSVTLTSFARSNIFCHAIFVKFVCKQLRSLQICLNLHGLCYGFALVSCPGPGKCHVGDHDFDHSFMTDKVSISAKS